VSIASATVPSQALPSPTPASDDASHADEPLTTWPLLVWLLVQLAALGVAAARVPLAGEYPRDAERLAVYLLLATQIVAASALMPWLLRGWRASLLAAACCWPMLGIATMLSSIPPARAFTVGAYVTGWVAVLSVSNAAAPSRRVAFILSAVASAVAAGGPLLWYLRTEFASPDASAIDAAWHHGPVPAAFSLASGGPVAASGWLLLLAVLALGGMLLWIKPRLAAHKPLQHVA
jgi:hypothetical protein